FGSLDDDRCVPHDLAGAVEDGGRADSNCLILRGEGRRRRNHRCKDSNLHSHGAHYNPLTRAMLKPISVVLAAAALVSFADAPMVEWPFYGGDPGGAKYSTLTDVNTSNVSRLGVAWE